MQVEVEFQQRQIQTRSSLSLTRGEIRAILRRTSFSTLRAGPYYKFRVYMDMLGSDTSRVDTWTPMVRRLAWVPLISAGFLLLSHYFSVWVRPVFPARNKLRSSRFSYSVQHTHTHTLTHTHTHAHTHIDIHLLPLAISVTTSGSVSARD